MNTWQVVPPPSHANLIARGEFDTDRKLAEDVLATWGLFIKKKDHKRLVELLAQDVLSYPDRCVITRIARTVEALAYGVIHVHAVDQECVAWPDDRVEVYVRVLSSRDTDRAAKRNRRGWDAVDSEAGHFCNAIIDRDRAVALQIARRFVGKYQRQVGDV